MGFSNSHKREMNEHYSAHSLSVHDLFGKVQLGTQKRYLFPQPFLVGRVWLAVLTPTTCPEGILLPSVEQIRWGVKSCLCHYYYKKENN